jgi:hypothetical protein
MELQKINVKFFVAEPNDLPLAGFIDLFHGWIQASDGMYHDVADYSHMQAGPGIVLVANDANLSIDETGYRRGLLYSRKSQLKGSNESKLREVVRSALENCRRIEEEPLLGRKLRFLGNELVISINDRLLAPNTDACFQEIKPEIESLAKRLYTDAEVTLERDSDPRKLFNVHIKTPRALDLKELLSNLHDN